MAELLTYDEREAVTMLDCALRPPPVSVCHGTNTTTNDNNYTEESNACVSASSCCVVTVLLLENMDLLAAQAASRPGNGGRATRVARRNDRR